MATPNYDINYNDKRFTDVEADKKTALSDLEKTYAGMIDKSDKYYQDQINASKQWADKQSQIQQDNTDFAIEKIEQQKYQAQKDYTREQSGAYVDWQKQTDPYGANAEKMAAQGLQNSGYSESSLVSMYNTYQNRVATARESYNNAVLNYNNSIKEAQSQNNSILAEIAHEALQKQLELSLQGFQYENTLILEKANKKTELENTYYARYQDVLAQINQENALAEQIRQFNQNYDLQVKEYNESIRQFNQNYDLQVKEYNESIRQFNEEIARLKAQDKEENEYKIKQLELQKKELEEEKRQFDAKMAEEKRQFDETMAYNKSKSSGSSGGSSGGSGGTVKGDTSGGSGGGFGGTVKGDTSGSNTKYTAIPLRPDKSYLKAEQKEPPIDMQSVIDLGYGMISEARLVELENQGKVTSRVVNGKRVFTKTLYALNQPNLFKW